MPPFVETRKAEERRALRSSSNVPACASTRHLASAKLAEDDSNTGNDKPAGFGVFYFEEP